LIAAGESSSPAADEVQGPPPGPEEQPTDDAWERFRAAMGASSAAMDDDPHELAEALNALADAARRLAGALAERSPR